MGRGEKKNRFSGFSQTFICLKTIFYNDNFLFLFSVPTKNIRKLRWGEKKEWVYSDQQTSCYVMRREFSNITF